MLLIYKLGSTEPDMTELSGVPTTRIHFDQISFSPFGGGVEGGGGGGMGGGWRDGGVEGGGCHFAMSSNEGQMGERLLLVCYLCIIFLCETPKENVF